MELFVVGALLLLIYSGFAFTIGAAIWVPLRNLCRILGMPKSYQRVVPSAVLAALILAVPLVLVLRDIINKVFLDSREKTCRSEAANVLGVTKPADLTVTEHHDFWTTRVSGGGFVMSWVSEPYQTPKVWLNVRFASGGSQHEAFIECMFAKLPNTGDPPDIAFESAQVVYHSVLVTDRSGVTRSYPWHPGAAGPANTPAEKNP
jgi:hypothetical protein